MNDYFVLDWDATPNIVGHVEDRNERSLANKFTRGRLLGTELAPAGLAVRVESGPDGAYPDYFTLQQIPIASQRFVDALRPVANNFEAFPVDIVMPGRTIKGHQVLNIVGRVTCLDRERTVSTLIDPKMNVILRMKKLAIDASKASGLSLFRLHEFPVLVLASETVRDALNGLRGVSLLPAQGWSDSVWF